MNSAPRDCTTVRLLVRYSEDELPGHWTPLEDDFVSWTIGHNNFDNDGEDRWRFVGWDWSQDHYLQAPSGEAIGWLPFHGDAPAQPAGAFGDLPSEREIARIVLTAIQLSRKPRAVASHEAIVAAQAIRHLSQGAPGGEVDK